MAQHDMVLNNAPGLTFRTDANAALAALTTVSAGAIEPPTKYPGMLWLDLSISPNGGLRMRNQTNTAWVPVVFAVEPIAGASTMVSYANATYTGTDAANVTFPVGTTIVVITAAGARARSLVPRIYATDAGQYTDGGAGALLAGSWRQRGQINLPSSVYMSFAQRTA